MPVTPVGQIPYPSGSDKPLIPTDLKNLATGADSWISGLDTALAGRVSAVGTRLDNVASRLAATTANLGTSNTTMTSGDTALTSAQNALTVVESRLATQDTTATTLQSRYNTDLTNLNNFSQRTPMGVTKIIPRGETVTSSSSTQTWLSSAVFNIGSAPDPRFRVSYVVTFKANNFDTGWIEFRTCVSIGTSGYPSWGWYTAQASFTRPTSQNPQSFIMSSQVGAGPINGSGVLIALGCVGDGSLNYSVNVDSGSIQYLTTG